VATVVAPEQTIAVLLFENLSEGKAGAYFADGIQREIIARLTAQPPRAGKDAIQVQTMLRSFGWRLAFQPVNAVEFRHARKHEH